MPQNRRIYLLDPKKLSPETIAVTFAKTSRSSLPFDAIAEEISDERAADFHEKWVVGYGHSSVAEHAVLHIAIENVSRLAIECLESNRLASYTEKSSRYQVWDADHYYIPDEFNDKQLHTLFVQTCRDLFSAYQESFTAISEALGKQLQPNANESERAFQTRVRSTSADVCRYFLPACSLANVGISINARALEHAIIKMLSHPLREVQAIGHEIKHNALDHVPTLVKYADPSPYLISLRDNHMQAGAATVGNHQESEEWCSCISCSDNGQEKILAALLYRFSTCSMAAALDQVNHLNNAEKKELVKKFVMMKGTHDQVLREFEYGSATIDLVLDQGAYFELKRHRMMTQTAQAFTPALGFAIPKLIEINGLSDLFKDMMHTASAAYETLAKQDPTAAAYVLPNAFNRRVLMNINLRSAIHLVKLRCAENAHFAIRRPILRIAETLQEHFPLFDEILTPCTDETWQGVEKDYFSETHAN